MTHLSTFSPLITYFKIYPIELAFFLIRILITINYFTVELIIFVEGKKEREGVGGERRGGVGGEVRS